MSRYSSHGSSRDHLHEGHPSQSAISGSSPSPRKLPEPLDSAKFEGMKLHEWMERCERMSIMMIHSLQQHATCILSHYGSKNSTTLEQWRQQGFEETKKFLEKVPENLRNEFMYTTALPKKHVEKYLYRA